MEQGTQHCNGQSGAVAGHAEEPKEIEIMCKNTENAERKQQQGPSSEGYIKAQRRELLEDDYTKDGTVDRHGNPALRRRTGRWMSATLVLVNQGLATLAFFGLSVNLVLFLTRVLRQSNASAANNVSKWTGTVYMFSLLGAFISDSYLGRYRTCALFLGLFVAGLVALAASSQLMLLHPHDCGDSGHPCDRAGSAAVAVFYVSVYAAALGNGGYQPNAATFGADQFDAEADTERRSKVAFFSWFYLALNLGSLFSNTFLGYLENRGQWTLGFWLSAISAAASLLVFLAGTPRYRHFPPQGNPLTRFSQVLVAAARKIRTPVPENPAKLFHEPDPEPEKRRILHTYSLRCLDHAAVEGSGDVGRDGAANPWRLCPVEQVEEVKCVVRVLPIWLCTIMYSVMFTQMASIFVEQGAVMDNNVGRFRIPPAAMSSFDIIGVAVLIVGYRRVIAPLARRLMRNGVGLTELQRMAVGLVIGALAMISAGLVEMVRLRMKTESGGSRLGIMWQVPQYFLVGASEVFMYVGQLEFFNSQAPEGLKSFGSALCMASMSLGNYVSSGIVSLVMDVTRRGNSPGWIPDDLNQGKLHLFFFTLAACAALDLLVFFFCARRYVPISLSVRGVPSHEEEQDDDDDDLETAPVASSLPTYPQQQSHCRQK